MINMKSIKSKRVRQIIKYGWKDAGKISDFQDASKSRLVIFFDILSCFKKYYVFSNQYKDNRLYALKEGERLVLCEKIGNSNKKNDNWTDVHNSDWRFLSKYTSLSWQNSQKKRTQRKIAYNNHYGLGGNVSIQYGVTIICEHYSVGRISCGKKVLFARNVDIDYTGDLIIGDNVKISEGVKILTHNHNIDYTQRDAQSHGLIKTPLTIKENVGIGAHAIIMPGVTEIGRGAMIATGAIVKKKVPPYAIVMGCPARIVGFRYTPDQIMEFEQNQYPAEDRLPEELLIKNYKKYYLDKLLEIKQFIG